MTDPQGPDRIAVGPAIPQLVSRPDSTKYHMIADHDLERMMKIEKPLTLAVATTTGGAVLGLLPQIVAALRVVNGDQPLMPDDAFEYLLYAIAWALCLGICLVSGWVAYKGKSEAEKILTEIRRRPLSPLG